MSIEQNVAFADTQAGPTTMAKPATWWERNQLKLVPYIFVSPFFILFSTFLLYPVIDSFFLSFHRQQGLGTPEFIGLQNYLNLTVDPRFKHSVINTTGYALGSVFLLSPLAFILAIVVHSRLVPWPNIKSFYRLSFFVPLLTSSVVASLMFGVLYDFRSGLINTYLVSLFGEGARVGWVRDPDVALFSIILLLIWKYTGLNSLYFLAGLQNVPRELEEAAAIDGANWWIILTRVTLPLMKPVILFVVVTAINGAYQIFAEPYLLTGGGPRDATLSITQYLYNTGFSYFNLGYAAAIGYTLVVIIVVLAVINLRLFGAFQE